MDAADSGAAAPIETEAGETPTDPTYPGLIKLAFATILRERKAMYKVFALSIFLGAITGVLFQNLGNDAEKALDIVAAIDLMITFTTLIGLFPTVATLRDQIKNFRNQNFILKSTMSFYIARIVVDMIFLILASATFTTLIYVLIGQTLVSRRFYWFLFFCTMPALISYSLALTLVVLLPFRTNFARSFIALLIVVPMLLASGYLIHFAYLSSMIAWLANFNFVRYAFEGALISMYGDGRADLQCHNFRCTYQEPTEVINHFFAQPYGTKVDQSILALILIGLQALAPFLLYRTSKRMDRIQKQLRMANAIELV